MCVTNCKWQQVLECAKAISFLFSGLQTFDLSEDKIKIKYFLFQISDVRERKKIEFKLLVLLFVIL